MGTLVLLQILVDMQTQGAFDTELEPQAASALAYTHHGQFGGALLKRWKFPDAFIHIVLSHEDIHATETITKDLLVVHVANQLVTTMGYGPEPLDAFDLENSDAARLLRLTPVMLADLESDVRTTMTECDLSLD